MARSTFGLTAALILGMLSGVRAQATCNSTSLCGTAAPCCSEFGFCGTADYCLGGCNPLASNTLDACKPNPVCKDATYTFPDLSRVYSNATHWDGNATAYDFVVDKGNIINTNSSGGELAMLLTETNGGTRLSSTRYVHYGTISATMKTGRWNGVVTAFITMSNVKDEIDWEFPGANTTTGQTNMFWQGVIPSATQGDKSGGLSDTFSNYHTYTIDWQPDTLQFQIDGATVRTLKKSDTLDSNGVAHYPTTPSRIQLSLWPAGIDGVAAGTQQWAGGMIDWTDPDYTAAGHFYALVQKIDIKCADADPSNAAGDITSYVYGANASALTPSVAFSNQSTLINGAGEGALRVPRATWVASVLAGLLVVAAQFA